LKSHLLKNYDIYDLTKLELYDDCIIDYYKTDNLDDSELQARLYAEIYYESNIDSESRAMDAPRTIKFNDMADETNIESEEMQHEPEKQLSVSETDRGKASKIYKKNFKCR